MTRSILVCLAIAVAPLAVACDKSGSEAQTQANEAQEKANREIAKAGNEANAKAVEAQSEADKKVAAAQADFAKAREDYRHKVQTDLDALNKTIDELDAKAMKATGKAKADLEARLPVLKAQRDAFVTDFRALQNSTAVTWDSMKARLDKELTDLKASADKVS